MIENFLYKIGTFFKGTFSLKRTHSDNQKSFASAKGNGAKAGSMSGNYNSQHIAENIYNVSRPNVEALADAKSWEKLIACFSEESTQRIAKNITDPLMQKNMKTLNDPGNIKWLKDKFKNVPMHKEDSRAKAFVSLQMKAIADLESFISSKDEAIFKEAWASHGNDLLSIRDK